jgi:hypothetical protein
MKFLCLDCDEPMKLHSTEGPSEGSLAVTFRCPECGFRVAMLTNPFETQMVQSLGVKVGGRATPPAPFEHLRASMANQRPDVFDATPMAAGDDSGTGGCPFAGMLAEGAAAGAAGAAAGMPTTVAWEPAAEVRVERIPSFIRPMAKRAIERYAESKGYPTITEAVMDEARADAGDAGRHPHLAQARRHGDAGRVRHVLGVPAQAADDREPPHGEVGDGRGAAAPVQAVQGAEAGRPLSAF